MLRHYPLVELRKHAFLGVLTPIVHYVAEKRLHMSVDLPLPYFDF